MNMIILAFPAGRRRTADRIGELLSKNGFTEMVHVETGSEAIRKMSRMDGGILICSAKLSDMDFTELVETMPPHFEMLLLHSGDTDVGLDGQDADRPEKSRTEDGRTAEGRMAEGRTEDGRAADGRIAEERPEETVITLRLPVRVREFIEVVRMMDRASVSRRTVRFEQETGSRRDPRDENYIRNAKDVLMQKSHISEEEAHRFLQKTSMDTGRSLAESAKMLLLMEIMH